MSERRFLSKSGHSKILTSEIIYTDEEFEFLKAVEHYKQVNHRSHPTWCEILGILKSLGWQKVDPPHPVFPNYLGHGH